VVALVTMPPERFPHFVEAAVTAYAADNVASGRWPPHDAESLARSEFEHLLPNGQGTPDNFFCEIREEARGEAVGFVWFGSLLRGRQRHAYLYQLLVGVEHRRRGYARSALAAFEALAQGMGFTAVALNVFGSNHAAQALYRSAGYTVMNIGMRKELGG
jgi:ribosomal protein S18 acetylase RimI-like enzyme